MIARIKSEKNGVVIDGWFAWEEDEVESVKRMNGEFGDKIEWVFLFIPKWMSFERCKKKPEFGEKKNIDLSWSRAEKALKAIQECEIIQEYEILDNSDFECNPMLWDEYEKRSKDATEAEVTKLLKEITDKEHYQNIELPFGHTTKGYTDCEASWRQIKPLLDWKGKTVLDVGCYWGYFCFQIKGEGADKVVGADVDADAIKVARKIRDMKQSDITFKVLDIENDDIPPVDVILLLNTLHHLRSPFHVLRKIFAKAKIAIFEVEMPHDLSLRGRATIEMGEPIKLSGGRMGGHLRFSKEMLMRFASENGYFLKTEVSSFRPYRTILVFRR
jgi:ribosomal protein L11 methylase PrmA